MADKKGTVLLVDDEAPIRAMAEEGLPLWGYEVITASTGEEALEIYRQRAGEIDLVVLDLLMPGMGGKKCLEGILAMDPGAKVLVTSGRLIEDEILRKASAHLMKPFSLKELVDAIGGILSAGP